MALTRLNAFPTGSVLTNGQITGEFDNIYNNALTLISPLTANLDVNNKSLLNLARGSAAAPSLYFNADSGTGLYSAAANQVGWSVAGAAVSNFTTAAAGPHVIGSGTTNTRYALALTGTITLSGATQEAGFESDQALTNASGVNLYGVYFTQSLTNVAGATTTMAWLTLNPGAITITAGSVTNAAGLYITGAPSGATNNYAVWVAGGVVRLDGKVDFSNATASTAAGTALTGSVSSLVFIGGTSDTRWNNNSNLNERMRLTDAGILLLGTTVTTGAAAGNFVLPNNIALKGVNAAGTNTVSAIVIDTSNRVFLAPDTGVDIRWGTALVALGAGGAATLGNTGGSGPATTTQNTWMRVIDSAGAAFWVPAWK